jgi:hypothetical protein
MEIDMGFRAQHAPDRVTLGQFAVYEPSSKYPITVVFEDRVEAENVAAEMVRRHKKNFFVVELVSYVERVELPIAVTRLD